MAVADGRRDEDEDGAGLFEEEGMDFADDIDHSDIPIHLRPLVTAAESGDLDALRQALGNRYSLPQVHTRVLMRFNFVPPFSLRRALKIRSGYRCSEEDARF